MRNMFGVYFRDIKRISTNFVAAIVAIGLIVIPSLYAWFNIAASWDPYGSTVGIKVAVASNDKGISIEGENINVGESVVDNLRKNHDIGWQFVDEKEAVEGVKSGKYYAALVIPSDFSNKISSVLTGDIQKPVLQYYVNEKKNAIAPKITDKGMSSLQQTINQTFIKESSKAVLKVLNLTDEAFQKKGIDPIEDIMNMLRDTSKSLKDFSTAVYSFRSTTLAINDLVNATKTLLPDTSLLNMNGATATKNLKELTNSIRTTTNQLSDTLSTLSKINQKNIESIDEIIGTALDELEQGGENGVDLLENAKNLNYGVIDMSNKAVNILFQLQSVSEKSYIKLDIFQNQINRLTDFISIIQDVNSDLTKISDTLSSGAAYPKDIGDKVKKALVESKALVSDARDNMDREISPKISNTTDQLLTNLDGINSLLLETNATLPKMGRVLDHTNSALNNGANALESTNILLIAGMQKIDKILADLESVEEDDRFSKFLEIIREDPATAGDFMSSPVTVNTHEIYPIKNYGSAMAPFYTILAIWVGALILASILKCKVEEDDKYYNLKPHEIYFSRYLLFMTFGILQSLLVCVGDLYGLQVQCLHPAKFILAGVFASIVFTLIIFTLTISFGDVGKAVAVVIMVIQVAASGGTFPIEVTPAFFKAVNPFLPFTFGINSLRECVAGIYENAYYMDLLALSAFIPISLILGLVLRKPIINLKNFFEERLEKTGVL